MRWPWAVGGLLLWPVYSGAAEPAAVSLPPLFITAPPLPALTAVSVLDRPVLERSADLITALRGQPGVSVTRYGGAGQAAAVMLRGTSAQHTLVLVDDLKIASATLGAPAWQTLPLAWIERIDLIRGPRAGLYGIGALGGALSLTTRGRVAAPWQTRAQLEVGGAERGVNGTLGLAGSQGSWWFNSSLGFAQAPGFNACRGVAGLAGCFVDEADDDGYRARHIALRGGYDRGETLAADVSVLYSATKAEYDGDFYSGNRDDSSVQLARLRLDWRPLSRWRSQFILGRSAENARIDYEGRRLERYDTRRDTMRWRNEFALAGAQRLTLGVDREHERIATTTDYARKTRTDWGWFGQYRAHFAQQDVELSLRQDARAAGAGELTGHVDWRYVFNDGLALHLGYGTAVRLPTFNELYYPGYGNPALAPERGRSVEVSISGEHKTGEWGLSLYRTVIADLIAYDATQRAAANLERARITGAEFWGRVRVAGWEIDARLTWLDPRNDGGGIYDGNRLPRRPDYSARLEADRVFGRLRLGGTLFVSGPRYDDLANQTRLDGFTLLGLRAEYALTPALRLYARVENLCAQEYETAAYYPQPGREWFAGLRYEF